MPVKALTCPICGGKVLPAEEVCRYCGTYLIIEGGKPLVQTDAPCTDENMEKYIRQANLIIDHTTERTGKIRIVSTEEVADCYYKARDDLREEFSRKPTMKEVIIRAYQYTSGITQSRLREQVGKQIGKGIEAYIIVIIIGTLLMLLLLWWSLSRR